jgi:hypothetical protein
MDPISAFHFSNITGAGYLDDPIFPFTPKGTMKILREAFSYHIVTGIFDRDHFAYSPVCLAETKPFLFHSDKFLILSECMSEQQFQEQLQKADALLRQEGLSPTDFLFLRIEAWKKGNGMECFLEYLACEYFRKQGYLVENQIPLVHAVGSPDFGGFRIQNAAEGFHITDLAMIRITGNTSILRNLDLGNPIVGEAKTSTTVMASQLKKYLNTSLFEKGFEMHPDKSLPSDDHFGLLHLDPEGTIEVLQPAAPYCETGDLVFSREEYRCWYRDSLKFYILANLHDSELYRFVQDRRPKGKYSQKKIIDTVRAASLPEIIQEVCRCVIRNVK